MKYYKNGKTYESPIMVDISGCTIELTDEQISRLGYMPYDMVKNMSNMTISPISMTKNLSLYDIYKFKNPDGFVDESDSAVTLPFRPGKKWVPGIVGTNITYILEDDPNGIGTESNPVAYINGIRLVNGCVYRSGGSLYMYNGEDSTADNDEITGNAGITKLKR